MPNTTWKSYERRIAALLGGRRLGATGDDGPDVLTPTLSVQCKHRKTLPQWIGEAVDNARRGAGNGRLGVALLHANRQRDLDSLVVMRLGDYIDWHDPKGSNCEQKLHG